MGGVKTWTKQNKTHLHFCFFFSCICYVDNGCFCVCVDWGKCKRRSVRAGEERDIVNAPGPWYILEEYAGGDGGRVTPVP